MILSGQASECYYTHSVRLPAQGTHSVASTWIITLLRRVQRRACWMWLFWWPTPLSWRQCCIQEHSTASTFLSSLWSLCPSQCRSLLASCSSSLVSYYFWKDFFVCCNFIYVMMCFLLFPSVKYDLNDVKKQPRLTTMNNTATVFVFFTVLINIIITALGFESGGWAESH